jgi:hypothetical protein
MTTFKTALNKFGFKPHNNKSKELVASKFHSSIRNVRIVVSTGTDKNTGKVIAGKQAQFKAVFINNQSQWRTIASGMHFKPGSFKSEIPSKLIAIEAGAESASSCKCGAKKFKAKSGNVVCANACWANKGWSGKKKYVGTRKNTSQRPAPARTSAQKKHHRTVSRAKQEAEKKAQAKIDLTRYTTFVPGQLVKIVEPQQLGTMRRPDDDGNIGEGPDFIGTVTKVETVGVDPSRPLANVWVMWMHSGVTDQHNNYNSESGNATYLVPVA